MKNIQSEELKTLLNSSTKFTILDVRTASEFAGGSIPNSININLMSFSFARKVKELPKDAPYVVVCKSGNRSKSACAFMNQLGFEEVYNLEGGMMQWNTLKAL